MALKSEGIAGGKANLLPHLFFDKRFSRDGAEEFAVGGDFAAGNGCAVSQCERLFVI